ncbi:MAG TPA: hypothetical protein VLD57_03460 [Blastocatellia bacterium]|nr:hypothetical protein [Blastocatellia bacterium]
MSEDYDDLLSVLAEARRSVGDSRLIWCVSADNFETTVSHRRGLILGGAWSPRFLRDRTAFGWDVPWTVYLYAPSILIIDKAVAPFAEWIPLMEAQAQARESLLLVTREVSTELLRTFIVNYLKETLACCVIRYDESLHGWGVPAPNGPWEYRGSPPSQADLLPRAAEGWVRRTSTVLFPSAESQWQSVTTDIAVISVGGENHEDQQDRLRFLMKEIQEPV